MAVITAVQHANNKSRLLDASKMCQAQYQALSDIIPFYLFESLLTPWSFYETHTLVPVFANQKRFEEDFCFYKKKIDFSIFFFFCISSKPF